MSSNNNNNNNNKKEMMDGFGHIKKSVEKGKKKLDIDAILAAVEAQVIADNAAQQAKVEAAAAATVPPAAAAPPPAADEAPPPAADEAWMRPFDGMTTADYRDMYEDDMGMEDGDAYMRDGFEAFGFGDLYVPPPPRAPRYYSSSDDEDDDDDNDNNAN